MHRIDGPGATVDNKFTAGNPTAGTPATVVTPAWLTAVQEEMAAVIEFAELELDKPTNTQLLAAILSLIAGGGVALAAADIPITDAGGFYAGGNVEEALQELGTQTLNTKRLRREIYAVALAANNTVADHAESVVEVTNAAACTYKILKDATLSHPIGTALHIAQGGAGQVTIDKDPEVTFKIGASFLAKTMEQEAIVVAIKVAANVWRLTGQLEAA